MLPTRPAMDITYSHIISAFVDKYGLSRGQVIAEIERTFSSMLSRWHQKNVVVVFAEGRLSAVGYHDHPTGLVQTPIDLTAMRGWKTIKRILDKNLSMAACMEEVCRYKRRENRLVWGEVAGRREYQLDIELEMEFGVVLYARCPLRLLGPHERYRLSVGERRAFHLRRVEAVMVGDTPRTQLTVDRVSKTLVEQLIGDKQPHGRDIRLSCRKRYVGKKSFVESSVFLPKRVIVAAARELGEHIQVKVVRDHQQ